MPYLAGTCSVSVSPEAYSTSGFDGEMTSCSVCCMLSARSVRTWNVHIFLDPVSGSHLFGVFGA